MCFPTPFKMNSPKSAKAAISTFPVDPDGNLLTDGRFDYSWNAENRLISITTKDTEDTKKKKLEFTYDYMGRRTIKKVHSWTGTDWQLDRTVTFVYDNYNEIARFEDGSLAKKFIWGEDLSGSLQGAGGVGGLLLVADSTNTYAPVYDANGNITAYVDASTGAKVADYSYSPFGKTITKSGSKAGDFDYRFSTKPEDEETGLVYYIFRYYDPEMGRWTKRDPIEETVDANVYLFAGNNSLMFYDNLGAWRPSQHATLTKASWALMNKPFVSVAFPFQRYATKLKNMVVYYNLNTDTDPATENALEYHFTRSTGPGWNYAKYRYRIMVKRQLVRFGKSLKQSPKKLYCRAALKIMGQLAHSWQDYYAHGIEKRYQVQLPFLLFGGAKPGVLTGNPDFPGQNIKPCSWGDFSYPAEHGPTEPGERAPDRWKRRANAIKFVKTKFNGLIRKFWKACYCHAKNI